MDDGDVEDGLGAAPVPGAAEPVADALTQDPSDVAVHRGCQAVWGGTSDGVGPGVWDGVDEGGP